jgi:DNA excision repair protein ERCC-5
VSSLRKFREWFLNGKKAVNGAKSVLKSKLRNVELSENFPNIEIARAYLEPKVDENKEPFSWGNPDKESLIEYTKNKLGWTRFKTEEILEPVMKRLNERKQATIKDYFKSQVKKKFHDNSQLSKRVQKALDKMKNDGENDEEKVEEKEKKPKVKRTRKRKVDTKCDEVVISSDDEEMKICQNEPQPSTSKAAENEKPMTEEKSSQELFKTKKAPVKRKQKTKNEDEIDDPVDKPTRARKVKIPDSNPVIPQREKDKLLNESAKQKAIEVFNKSKDKKKP